MDTFENRLGALQIIIILLAVATAIIHIVVAIPDNLIPFYLNGLGYLALVTALYLPQLKPRQGAIRWVLIGYTALTILLWIIAGERSGIAYLDKLIEVALIILLFVEARQSTPSTNAT